MYELRTYVSLSSNFKQLFAEGEVIIVELPRDKVEGIIQQ